jgi:hypothetical protein
MDLLTRDELDTLLVKREELCASIYMPTYQAGRETLQNPIQFKKLLTEVEEQLVAQGVRAPVARAWLEPARTLIEDQRFWQRQNEGLAAFISADLFQIYRLPLKFDDLAMVSSHFYLKPLLPLLSGDGLFYILTLSKRQVRFLQGSRFNITEIALEGTEIPKSMAEALQYDETPERGRQFPSSPPSWLVTSWPMVVEMVSEVEKAIPSVTVRVLVSSLLILDPSATVI